MTANNPYFWNHTITIIIKSDVDPSQVLDSAIIIADDLAGMLDGTFDEAQVSVGTRQSSDRIVQFQN